MPKGVFRYWPFPIGQTVVPERPNDRSRSDKSSDPTYIHLLLHQLLHQLLNQDARQKRPFRQNEEREPGPQAALSLK
jgi:hypothetical protein